MTEDAIRVVKQTCVCRHIAVCAHIALVSLSVCLSVSQSVSQRVSRTGLVYAQPLLQQDIRGLVETLTSPATHECFMLDKALLNVLEHIFLTGALPPLPGTNWVRLQTSSLGACLCSV